MDIVERVYLLHGYQLIPHTHMHITVAQNVNAKQNTYSVLKSVRSVGELFGKKAYQHSYQTACCRILIIRIDEIL